MIARVFVDTNVLVYVFDRDEPHKQRLAQRVLEEEGRAGNLVLSTQVLQEFYVTVTRKLPRALSPKEAELAIRGFSAFTVQPIDRQTVLGAMQRAQRWQYSLWDSLILEAAVVSGCTRLLTEDLQAGHRVDGLRIENPFS